jgi:hypothetical protein
MRSSVAAASLVSMLILAAAPAAEGKTMAETIKKAVISGAASKPTEFAVKAASGLIYNVSCPPKTAADNVGEFLCGVLGSVSGKSEEEWKKAVDTKLKEMSGQLTKIDDELQRVSQTIQRNHKETEAQFEQAAVKVVATQVIVRVDNLFNRFKRQLGAGSSTNRAALLDFAGEVMGERLHTKLGDLNVVLTSATLEGQPMLRYPFYMWSIKNSRGMPPEIFDPRTVYDFAEQKFMYYRSEQQKLYLVYLWAAEILESQCEITPSSCTRPPVSSIEFKKIFDDYTQDQIIAFNQAADWLILSYANPHMGDERSLAGLEWVGNTEEMLLRANLLTSTIVGERNGLWGRVYSMGNKWNGSLEVQCGAQKRRLSPALRYTLPVVAPDRTLDWWVADNADRVYNQVRFATEWTMVHYQMPEAPAGPCTVNATLPDRAGMLPWVESGSEVVAVGSGSDAYTFGSFIAMQRAGGAYALASGDWKSLGAPSRDESGDADRADQRFNWKIVTARKGGPLAGIWSSGRGKYVIGKSSRVVNHHQIYFHNTKRITFPEDPAVTLNLKQSTTCDDLCDGPSTVVLEYDVANSDAKAQNGHLTANVAVFFDATTLPLDSPLVGKHDSGVLDFGNGVFVNGSYPWTGERKTYRTDGDKVGTVRTNPGTGYFLQYVVLFNLVTEGRGLDATSWNYKGRIAPAGLYLTK